MTTGAAMAATGTEFLVDRKGAAENVDDVEAGESSDEGAGVMVDGDVEVALFWSEEQLD
jgi:hypothetical protein